MNQRSRITSPASLGFALQQARLISGMTQTELATMIGANQKYVWELESGKDSKAVRRILDVLATTGARLEVILPEEQPRD